MSSNVSESTDETPSNESAGDVPAIMPGVKPIEIAPRAGGAPLEGGFRDGLAVVDEIDGGAVPADGQEADGEFSGDDQFAAEFGYNQTVEAARGREAADLEWFQTGQWRKSDRWKSMIVEMRKQMDRPMGRRRIVMKAFQWFLPYVRILSLMNSIGYEAMIDEFSKAVKDDEFMKMQLPRVYCLCRELDAPMEYTVGIIFVGWFMEYIGRVGGPFIDLVKE